MSIKDLFHSDKLLKYYKQGKLDDVLKRFKKYINKDEFLGAGGDASGFRYNDGKEVLKICMKDICYFKRNLLYANNQGQQFKNHINKLSPYFLPINEILFEDSEVLVYTQNFCKRLEKDRITPEVSATVFQMVRFMICNDALSTDIAPHNLGIYKNRLVLFDYHGLHPILRNGSLPGKKWWGRLIRNLTRYMSYIYAPDRIDEYVRLMKNFNEKHYKKIIKEGLLPKCYIDLLQYLMELEGGESIDELVDLLGDCIKNLLHCRRR